MPPGSHMHSDSDLESVVSLQDLRKAKLRRNSCGPKYNCNFDDCDAVFKRLDHLDRHEFKHTGIKKHACSYEGCDKIYSIVTHLKRHLRNTHERKESIDKNVPCAIESCPKMFTSACNMQRHIREVHENPKVYSCAHCSEKFTQKLKMRRHEITKHTGVYPYTCEKCSKGFYQQWQHNRHLANCKIYPCPNCTLQFEKWSMYLKHCKETLHGRKSYKCEHCTKIYAKPGELQRHVAAAHFEDTQQMIYKCTHDNCDRFYAYERNLRQHMQTAHSGKRFKCKAENCKRCFSSAQNLEKHLKRDHNKRKIPEEIPAAVTINKTKKARRKRKDAGKSKISHLAQLSGLAVDKQFDKLLRKREHEALSLATRELLQEMDTEDVDSAGDEKTTVSTSLNVNLEKTKMQELDALVEIVLNSD